MVKYNRAVAGLLLVSAVHGFVPRSAERSTRRPHASPQRHLRRQLYSTYYSDDGNDNKKRARIKNWDRLSADVNNLSSEAMESFSRAFTEDEEMDAYETEVARKNKMILEQSRDYKVTLPLTVPFGVTLCQVDVGREFSDFDLNADSLTFQAPPAPTSDQVEDGQVVAMNPSEIQKRLDPNFRGIVVSSVIKGGTAWLEGVRPGDILVSTSATVGDALWPKSTLEGVRSAIASRKVSARAITFRLERTTEEVASQYELTLTKPLGIQAKDTEDGFVEVTGFTANAPKLARYAINIGDRILAVDSALGDRMWPVSTVEGVISACTSRLPGQPIRMRFARPYGATEETTMSPVTTMDDEQQAVEAVAGSSPVDAQLLTRCREVLKRYSAEEQRKERVKFTDKYAVPALVAVKVMDAVASASSSLDAVTLSMVMNAYLSCRQPEEAIRTFEAAVGLKANGSATEVVETIKGTEKGELVPNKAALNLITGSSLMRAHSLNGDAASVQRVLAALEGTTGVNVDGIESLAWPETGIYGSIVPDTQCYNIALAALVKADGSGGVDAAIELFESMSEPSSLGGRGKPVKDLISFNTIIGALAKGGRSEEAFAMLDRMKRSNVKPDKYTYTSLINACVKEGDVQELLIDMKEQGVQPDVVTYNTMIRSLCARNQWFEAKNLVTEMESRGIPPDSMTYGLLMSGLLKAKKPSTCLTLFETACADQRSASLTENVHLYTTAIAASSAIGNHERALELVSRMNIAGVKPNLKTMTALMSACLSSGKADLAVDVYTRIDNPDGYAMLIAVRALCASGALQSASDLLKPQRSGRVDMSGKQVMDSFQTLLRTSLELGDYAMSRETLADLLGAGYIPSKAILQTIVQALDLIPPKKQGEMPSDLLKEIPEESFDYLLFVLDSFRARNLPCPGSFYSTVLHSGARMGGLRRKLASLLAESRALTVEAHIGNRVQVVVEQEDAKGKHVVGWEDLVHNYDSYKERLGYDVELPPIAVRIASKEVRQVLAAEKRVTYDTGRQTERRRQLV